MTTFDRAWLVVKAPLMPNSVRSESRDDGKMVDYAADFLDPETDEIVPMWGQYRHRKNSAGAANDLIDAQMGEPERGGPYNERRNRAWARTENSPARWMEDDVMQILEGGDPPPPGAGGKHEMRSRGWNNISDPTQFWPRRAQTLPEHRRKGYMTALYDLIARIAHEQTGKNLVSSGDDRTKAMRAFWASKAHDDIWPHDEVRI